MSIFSDYKVGALTDEEYKSACAYMNREESDTETQRPRWKKCNDDSCDWVECPECGYGSEGEVTSDSGARFRYCPWCGQKLEDEE